jgi:hypothetical protein
MRRITVIGVIVAAVASVATTAAAGQGVSPAQLQRAGWSCVNPAGAFPANPNVHCFPPGKLEGVIAGTAETTLLMTFATSDVAGAEAGDEPASARPSRRNDGLSRHSAQTRRGLVAPPSKLRRAAPKWFPGTTWLTTRRGRDLNSRRT